MMNQNNFITGTPIRDSVTNRQIGWVGPGGSVETMHGTVGYINNYNNSYRTFENNRVYENRIDNFGHVRTPLGDSQFKIG